MLVKAYIILDMFNENPVVVLTFDQQQFEDEWSSRRAQIMSVEHLNHFPTDMDAAWEAWKEANPVTLLAATYDYFLP